MTYKLSQRERQAAEVEAIEKELAEAAAAAAAPPVEPGSEPPAPAQPATPEPVAPVQPATPAVDPELEALKQRFASLEGKYRAEVPRLQAANRDLQTRLEAAHAALEASRTPTPPAVPQAPLVTEKDNETFGADLIDLITRKATELWAPREAALKAENETLRKKISEFEASVTTVVKSQEVSAHQIYLSKLTAAVPDWETINSDAGFLAWLGEVDKMSGLTRQQYLDHAYNTGDVERTAVIFNAWKAKVAAAQPPTPPVPSTTKTDIQRQVEPGKSKSSPVVPVADPTTRIWTTEEIEKFYAETRAGKVTAADQTKIEAEIDLAVATGRVR